MCQCSLYFSRCFKWLKYWTVTKYLQNKSLRPQRHKSLGFLILFAKAPPCLEQCHVVTSGSVYWMDEPFVCAQLCPALLFPTPGNLPDPVIEPESLASSALAGRFFTTSATWKLFVFWLKFVFIHLKGKIHLEISKEVTYGMFSFCWTLYPHFSSLGLLRAILFRWAYLWLRQ